MNNERMVAMETKESCQHHKVEVFGQFIS